MPLPPDPRTAPSLVAVERALAWYREEVKIAKSPPLGAAEVAALADALGGRRRWQPGHFEQLVTFGQAMYRLARLDPSVPDCNLGDALTALGRVELAGDASPAWSFQPAVDAEAFAKLEFREASVGIAKAQRENREGWWAHGQKNRAFIEQAAAASGRTDLVVVLGAGHAFDLPLPALARRFERVVLVDIDAAALEETAGALARERGSAASIETRVMDLTGINGALVRQIDERMAAAADGAAALESMAALCRSYRLPAPPRLWDGPPADVVVSSCVLSQLGWPQRTYAERLYDRRFGPMAADVESRWSTAWTELGLRVQQDHLNALGEAAPTVVLTSDVISRPTAFDARAGEKPTGRKIFALGVESLLERVPKVYRAGEHGQWTWSRYKASRKGSEGSVMDVEGVVLTEARSTSGLWLPG